MFKKHIVCIALFINLIVSANAFAVLSGVPWDRRHEGPERDIWADIPIPPAPLPPVFTPDCCLGALKFGLFVGVSGAPIVFGTALLFTLIAEKIVDYYNLYRNEGIHEKEFVRSGGLHTSPTTREDALGHGDPPMVDYSCAQKIWENRVCD